MRRYYYISNKEALKELKGIFYDYRDILATKAKKTRMYEDIRLADEMKVNIPKLFIYIKKNLKKSNLKKTKKNDKSRSIEDGDIEGNTFMAGNEEGWVEGQEKECVIESRGKVSKI